MIRFAENTKRLRKEKGWSQTELAERIGAHLAHISRVEAGKYLPSLDTAIKLANVFEVSIDYLVNGNDTIQEIRLNDQTFAEKIKLMNKLDDDDRLALSRVIDGLVTKTKMLEMLREIEAK